MLSAGCTLRKRECKMATRLIVFPQRPNRTMNGSTIRYSCPDSGRIQFLREFSGGKPHLPRGPPSDYSLTADWTDCFRSFRQQISAEDGKLQIVEKPVNLVMVTHSLTRGDSQCIGIGIGFIKESRKGQEKSKADNGNAMGSANLELPEGKVGGRTNDKVNGVESQGK